MLTEGRKRATDEATIGACDVFITGGVWECNSRFFLHVTCTLITSLLLLTIAHTLPSLLTVSGGF